MSNFLVELTDQLNLRWAWEKVRREARPGDIWFDEVELAGFELELERNLQSIAAEFGKGRYRLTPLRPVPFPKQPDKQGAPRVRQMFQVAIRDQVAWTAVVNVIGPHVDIKMPTWSYGNRLFRSIWVQEDKDGVKRRKIGSYRHASGRLFLPFAQSWPIFRRHVFLATQAMTNKDSSHGMDEQTTEELSFQKQLTQEQRCPFTVPEYWKSRRPQKPVQELYWCSIDLEKFYPTLRLSVVRENITEQLPAEWQADALRLLKSMLAFQLNTDGWTPDELSQMDIGSNRKTFSRIPTGLYVAGFLANAGLLKVNMEVVRRLKKRNIAHFQFVDDHIVLAYRMDDLVKWVGEYEKLLKDVKTGVRINSEKIEPEELAALFSKGKKDPRGKAFVDLRASAEKACRLDPEFPSPLMTKTLALVSSIGRIDFNLLDSNELTALTEQLEHLLLVDLPEEEMPEKTRLSFAATRLTRIAECRLANDEILAAFGYKRESLIDELGREGLTDEEKHELKKKLKGLDRELKKERERLDREVKSAFQLLRKVLSERPDRIRLWTRAVLMCRSTGVDGLTDLFKDIRREQANNALSAESLRANILVLIGAQALIAARILRDVEVAQWRKRAARSFLKNILAAKIEAPDKKGHWFLHMSWQQYCFGVRCAGLVLKDEVAPDQKPINDFLSNGLLAIGNKFKGTDASRHSPTLWAWWAGRMTLRDLEPRVNRLVRLLGESLKPSREVAAFWRFFPLDVPIQILESMIKGENGPEDPVTRAGWWFDALRERKGIPISLLKTSKGVMGRVQHMLTMRREESISLYEWCDCLQKLRSDGGGDPRSGEWTALEIVRQVGLLIGKVPTLSASYLRGAKKAQNNLLCVHPANFRMPRAWLMEKEPTWEEWRNMVHKEARGQNVSCVSKTDQIVDNRYTPLKADNPLFVSVNPVRGLGLLLYGLLRKNFDLPAMWNGPGHADVLGMLPKLLLVDMTCSSWTIGVLEGCLQPRVTENLFLRAEQQIDAGVIVDDDTLHDPVAFLTATDVVAAITICQKVLVRGQLSTLEHRARQLTPVDVSQLTSPQWSRDFNTSPSEEGGMHE